MLELIPGVLAVILIVLAGWIAHLERLSLAEQMSKEGEMMKINLDHIAGALVSMSELLDDAEGVIQEVQQIPSFSEILLQVGSQLLMNKLSPTIEPFIDPAGVISQLLPADEAHGETKQEEQPVTTEV